MLQLNYFHNFYIYKISDKIQSKGGDEMRKRVKKISAVLMGSFAIISLFQNASPKIPSKVISPTVKTGEIRVGGDKEGLIILGNNSRNLLTS